MKKLCLNIAFAEQLGLALEQNIPLTRALHDIAHTSQHTYKKQAQRILHRVEQGFFLSQAAKGDLHPTLIMMIQLGEESHSLGSCLRQAHLILTKHAEHQKNRRQAVSTPLINLVLSCFLALSLILTITPTLQELTSSLGKTPPALQQLSHLQNTFEHHLPKTMITSVVGLGLFYRFKPRRSKHLRHVLKLPLIRTLISAHHYYLWLITLQHMTQASITLAKAISMSESLFQHSILHQELRSLSWRLQQGYMLEESCMMSQSMPKVMKQAFKNYSQTGQSEHLDIAIKQLEQQHHRRASWINTLLPPILQLSNAGLIIWLAQSLYEPMTQLGEHLVSQTI